MTDAGPNWSTKPPRKRGRRHFACILAGSAVVIAAGVLGAQGVHQPSAATVVTTTAPAAGAAASTTAPAAAGSTAVTTTSPAMTLSQWLTSYGNQDMTEISADNTTFINAANAVGASWSQMAQACAPLLTHTTAAQAQPPVPDAQFLQVYWSTFLSDEQSAATTCQQGSTDENTTEIDTAVQDEQNAVTQGNDFTTEVGDLS